MIGLHAQLREDPGQPPWVSWDNALDLDTFSEGTWMTGHEMPLLGHTAWPSLIPATRGIFTSSFSGHFLRQDPMQDSRQPWGTCPRLS